MNAPEGFIIPTQYGNYANNGNVAAAYVGSAKGQSFRFFTAKIHNQRRSDETGIEAHDVIEFVQFVNDKYCSPAHRIDASLFKIHPEILSDYKRWKDGKDSKITTILDWDTISYSEKGMLIASGFDTVEQLCESPDERLMAVGPEWKNIKAKALQHVKAKKLEAGEQEIQNEFQKMGAELTEQKRKNDELLAMVTDLKATVDHAQKIAIKSAKEPHVKARKKAGVQSEVMEGVG